MKNQLIFILMISILLLASCSKQTSKYPYLDEKS